MKVLLAPFLLSMATVIAASPLLLQKASSSKNVIADAPSGNVIEITNQVRILPASLALAEVGPGETS